MQEHSSSSPHLQAKEDAAELRAQSVAIKAQIAAAEEAEQAAATARDDAIVPIGNIVHDSVPVHDDEVRPPRTCSRTVLPPRACTR